MTHDAPRRRRAGDRRKGWTSRDRRRIDSRVIATVLANPRPHAGQLDELTGRRSQDMHGIARECSDALNREVTDVDILHDDWERALEKGGVPAHLAGLLLTMAELHRAGRLSPGSSLPW